ncbi:MAG: MBL fold metallo-hydrolase [Clostridia bacterium]|nr:MBL fold metallo-hydrolase [Clostridia bacterium]
MKIKKIVSEQMDQNCYLIEENGFGILIDPGIDTEKILNEIKDVKVNYILLTHCHFDHLYSLNKIRGSKRVVGTKECSNNMIRPEISLCGRECLPDASCDIEMDDGEEIDYDGIRVKCIKTPGHTNGSCCYLIENNLFSGDTLFCQNIGRCDLPTGDYQEIEKSIRNKIYKLDDEITVYTGHGKETKIGFEKKFNAFFTE